MNKSFLLIAVSVAALSACSTTEQLQAPVDYAVPGNVTKDAGNPTSLSTTYLALSTVAEPDVCQTMLSGSKVGGADVTDVQDLADFYVQPVARYINLETEAGQKLLGTAGGQIQIQRGADGKPVVLILDHTSYDAAAANLLQRKFFGENRSYTVTGTLMADGTVIKTPPLYSTVHSSSRDGEDFNRSQVFLLSDQYFRVNRTSSVKLDIKSAFSQKMNTSALGAALEVAKTAASALAPASKILTPLNDKQLAKQAAVWDSALSGLMATSVTDSVSIAMNPGDVLDVKIKDKTTNQTVPVPAGACGMLVASMPATDVSLRKVTDADPKILVGSWLLGLGVPRASLFIENNEAKGMKNITSAGFKNLRPVAVLNEKLGDNARLGDVVSASEAYKNLTITDSGKKTKAKEQFCRTVVSDLGKLGLTDLDARIGLWAVINGLPFSEKPPECAEELVVRK